MVKMTKEKKAPDIDKQIKSPDISKAQETKPTQFIVRNGFVVHCGKDVFMSGQIVIAEQIKDQEWKVEAVK